MHKYMRAIGFSEYTDRKKLKELLTDVIMNSDHRAYTMNQEGILLGEFSKNHTATRGAIESGTFGVAVCGEFDDNDKFIYEYYFPYLTGSGITSYEDVSVERHADKDSYAGICDDIKVGISDFLSAESYSLYQSTKHRKVTNPRYYTYLIRIVSEGQYSSTYKKG